MDSYTITIATNDDSGAATRLVVDTSGEQLRITDVHLHNPHGLSSGQIPAIDIELLLRAVTASAAPNGSPAAAATALPTAAASTPALESAPAAEQAPRQPARKSAATQGAPVKRTPVKRAAGAPAKRARGTARPSELTNRAAQSSSTNRAAASAPTKRAAASAPTKRAAATKRAPAATATSATERVYRRTPDDLSAVFAQVSTVAGVANHYEVPRHTAQGWVNRLRAGA